MAARPPPARPHIGLNPSHRLSSYVIPDWAEDDAWDSGSDSESPSNPSWNRSSSFSKQASTSSSTAPKPVPRPNLNSSSSTLAFPPQNGWTIVRKSTDHRSSLDRRPSDKAKDGVVYEDVEGEMIVGELEPELADPAAVTHSRPRHDYGFVREDVEEIVNVSLTARSTAYPPTHPPPKKRPSPSRTNSIDPNRERSIRSNRRQKFIDCVSAEDVNMATLRKLAWNGVPSDLRPLVWPLLLVRLFPLPAPLRISTLARKRQEYLNLVELAFSRDMAPIEIDVPRTRPGVQLWMQAATQRLERILYVWAIRHPASGYVQGINDLATPFFQIFLSAYIDSDPEEFDPSVLPAGDNYIATQPGIHRSVKRMAELVARIDAPLAAHLDSENVEFMQFAFRWMNCLLMREISVQNTIRMWDTYLAEGADAFSQFHLYVCSAFLVRWSKKLREMDFQGIIMFLQSLPTQGWGDHEIEMLLSEAFVHYSTWHNAQSHFGKNK
ncbi:rab-GTPase-TBC domain-containing protein [Fomitopsis serialis]|uniref:rab-GTPase-TBC domain-containing protein n=1 Tax=Fomitopsis serialis TaxID=139415 RepID=UPI002008A6C7|nr:rab-GTPase-TBC domain-containing protein [Neoantrodia serialis]KAH9935649.1 rab-GTPase-TBC domain-containing protein [Neoantrodia serialis]